MALVIKSVTMGEGVKSVQNYVTSLMDDPKSARNTLMKKVAPKALVTLDILTHNIAIKR